MKPNNPTRTRVPLRQRGFALVISLSLMVLLTVLAVGLMSLSAVSLRSSGAGQARAEAEANARMALMMAIGELQTSMGPDQAVTARASSIGVSESDPNLLGTWKGWHWQPGTSGPTYSQKEGEFRRWLASMTGENTAQDVTSATFKDPVWLINPETVGMPENSESIVGAGLRGDKIPMELSETQRGAFAWAVMDESMKAPIQLREPENEDGGETPTKAELIARRIAPARARPENILEALDPEKLGNPAKIVSLDSAVVAVGKEEGKQILAYQGDVTPYSVGLLSDVAKGGLKTDLTTVFESSSASPNINGAVTVYNNANDGAPRWDYIKNHYQLHRKLGRTAGSGTPKLTLSSTDLRPSASALTVSPATERLMPVIAKLQIMFSAVSHYNHITDRVNWYNTKGVPQGNQNYGAPHLAYDPVVTLYNPYDVAITLQKLRVRVWDPPVLFGMKKNGAWLRDDFANNRFHSLARFQIANQFNENARRYFTLLLTDAGRVTPYGGAITMMPGEVRVFSPYVEKNWTWGMETAGQYTPRSFFDWDAGLDFGNVDNRTKNLFGVESVPGWDPRAGLQTDHLTYSDNRRPAATLYSFENPDMKGNGWMSIKLTDTFEVQAKPGRPLTTATVSDFTVDLLAGSVQDVTRDLLRTYRFRMTNPEAEMSVTPANPVISRNWRVGDILQRPGDTTPSGKSPFAILTMSAKTTADPLWDQSTPWVHNHPVVEGVEQNSNRVGNALDSYDLRFEEVTDFTRSPGIEFDASTNKGYYGATATANRGVSNVPMFRVPLLPAASLGDLIPANLVASAALPRVTHALGNSRAHPLLPSGGVTRSVSGGTTGSSGMMLDHSYLLNDALWDSTFFSTIANFSDNPLLPGRDRKTLLTEFFEGNTRLLNTRFTPLANGQGSKSEQAATLDGLDDTTLSKRMASVLGIRGPFNVNSDSIAAWKAMLTSLRDEQLIGWNMDNRSPRDKTGFSRFGLPIYGDGQSAGGGGIDVAGQVRWAGFRALTDDEINELATGIVTNIRARGSEDKAPSLTMGEFVNRRLGSVSSLHTMEGIIQKAISDSRINDLAHSMDSKKLTGTSNPSALTGMATAEARSGYSSKTGFSGEGAPSMLTQGDVLMALAPIITVRGDTFRIRAYGESRNPDGEVQAKAWCEAIVQRTPEYLDSSDLPEVKPENLSSAANERFGRRFNITSFRWLSPEEV
ncbi:hypothetical protein OJ996_12585 [Luteolibacter sp. GHJ8]|uniref:Verru_Chthon cassette protein A n=1 Tax=Luteolibacter rhizosphaerae TaxID=2989719 RepID=A0ABT3G418_9BACT|nr:hypothetical protein [Luteolibacter rhizosphaerae]